MGGGDLNMKKSFHPNTMKNLERVFNAELKRDTEMKKVEQLRREIAEERQREDMHRQAVETGVIKGKAARLDWMYSGPGAAASSEDREEYLLGKKIDKEVDPLQTKEDTTDSASASLFTDVTLSGANSQRDTAAKIREDPLFAIKKQEEQARKNLMSNPVRLKQLQHMLRAQAGSDEKKKKKKKKKDKHRDADVHHDRRSDDEEWSRHSHRHEEGRTRHDDDRTRHHRHSEDRTRYDDDRTHRQHYDRDRTHQRRYNEDITRRHRHDEDRTHHDQDTARHHLHGDDMTRRHHRHEDKSRHDEDRPTSARRGEDERPHRRRSRSRSPLDHAASSSHMDESKRTQPRCDPAEAEKRRQAMMSAASVHHRERDERIRKRKEMTDREEAALRSRSKRDDEQFLAANTLVKTSDMSVEDKIRRNINRVQRTKADIDKHFMKR